MVPLGMLDHLRNFVAQPDRSACARHNALQEPAERLSLYAVPLHRFSGTVCSGRASDPRTAGMKQAAHDRLGIDLKRLALKVLVVGGAQGGGEGGRRPAGAGAFRGDRPHLRAHRPLKERPAAYWVVPICVDQSGFAMPERGIQPEGVAGQVDDLRRVLVQVVKRDAAGQKEGGDRGVGDGALEPAREVDQRLLVRIGAELLEAVD